MGVPDTFYFPDEASWPRQEIKKTFDLGLNYSSGVTSSWQGGWQQVGTALEQ